MIAYLWIIAGGAIGFLVIDIIPLAFGITTSKTQKWIAVGIGALTAWTIMFGV